MIAEVETRDTKSIKDRIKSLGFKMNSNYMIVSSKSDQSVCIAFKDKQDLFKFKFKLGCSEKVVIRDMIKIRNDLSLMFSQVKERVS